MYYWISSKPLKMIITQSINYRKKKGKIFEEDTRNLVDFIPENPKHINIVVNEVIFNIASYLVLIFSSHFFLYKNFLK
jgi:hypothetical protein